LMIMGMLSLALGSNNVPRSRNSVTAIWRGTTISAPDKEAVRMYIIRQGNPTTISGAIEKVDEVFGGGTFLEEIAKAESNLGRDPRTNRPGYYGGVWQVDKKGLAATQDVGSHASLPRRFKEIKKEFGIDWTKVEWKDLRNPLHSAIAARLLLLNVPEPLPKDIQGRADYWKKYYNTERGFGKPVDYLNRNGFVFDKEVSSFKVGEMVTDGNTTFEVKSIGPTKDK